MLFIVEVIEHPDKQVHGGLELAGCHLEQRFKTWAADQAREFLRQSKNGIILVFRIKIWHYSRKNMVKGE
jgi:hypothetical protein